MTLNGIKVTNHEMSAKFCEIKILREWTAETRARKFEYIFTYDEENTERQIVINAKVLSRTQSLKANAQVTNVTQRIPS